MKYTLIILSSVLTLTSCIPFNKSEVSVALNRKDKSSIQQASISSVQIINNQLVINGAGLNAVSQVRVNGNTLNENFTIQSKTSGQIIANSIRAFSFDVSKVFNLILSDANASATFAIDFSLCNSTLHNAGFDCSSSVNNNDVLTYDGNDNLWVPRSLNGLSYQGLWNANQTQPSATQNGQYWIVSAANGSYQIGDWIVWKSSTLTFDHVSYPVVAGVTTIFGRTGAVVATKGDYSLDLLGDVDIPTPLNGQVLKYNGTHWIAADETLGDPGSVTTTELADNSVTNAKVVSVATSKLTGTISSSQITDSTIVNADISSSAAIDYSKINVPAGSIPYASLNIANGDIPASKISGLPTGTAVLATSITDGDTTHAPDGNSVFDALATKLDKTGGTISTMLNVPAPVLDTEATTKLYVDTADNLRLNKTGGTLTGALSLDSDLRIKGGTTNYVTIRGHATSTAYTLTLPIDDGLASQVLTTNGSGVLSWETPAGGTTTLTGDVGGTMSSNSIGVGKVTSSHILDGAIVDADVSATANIAATKIGTGVVDNTELSYLNNVTSSIQTQLDAKEAAITGGTTAQYVRGDKTLESFATSVWATVLTGLSTATNSTILAADTVLVAFGKLQAQIDAQITSLAGKLSLTGGNLTGPVQMNAQNQLRFADSDSSNYIALRAPATLGGNFTLTLPADDGGIDQVLTTDGSGGLSWTTVTTDPGGLSGQIQFNNAGDFGGDTNLVWDGSKLGVGTASPTAALTVQGAAVSRTNIITSGATVNLALANNHLLKAPGTSAITLQNAVDGGVYTLIVADSTSRKYTFSGCTKSYFSPENDTTTSRSTYTVMVVLDGASVECYVTWITDFNEG